MQAANHFSQCFSFWSDFFFCPWFILFLSHFATAPHHSLAALTLGYLSLWKNPLNLKHFQWLDLGLLLFSHQSFPSRCCWKEEGKKNSSPSGIHPNIPNLLPDSIWQDILSHPNLFPSCLKRIRNFVSCFGAESSIANIICFSLLGKEINLKAVPVHLCTIPIFFRGGNSF